MIGINQRSQLAAALLAFFLGMLGAHRYYLGEHGQGNCYLLTFFLSLVTTGILIGFLGLFCLAFVCLCDFIALLSTAPAAFDAHYNQGSP